MVSFDTHKIPVSTQEALKELQKQGIKIFIATGRPWCLIDNPEGWEFDGYITVNGSYSFTANQKSIYKDCIPQEDFLYSHFAEIIDETGKYQTCVRLRYPSNWI